MAREWLINIRGFAKKLRSTSLSSADQIKDCGACRECPNCHSRIDNSDVSSEWPGFPLGIKFDPSDVEILEHLAAKCGAGNIKPHMFIEEFIPTLEGEQGICYTHPENLPGAKKDGSSVHFFHRTMNAYSSGQRKRRKIHHRGSTEDHVRWHKTGKTKAIIEHGEHKGFKKIMVLYIRSEKESKSYKSDWKMHQYHLGTDEDEKNGEYVVSKIFYKQNEKNEEKPMAEEPDSITSRTSPRTPKPNPPNPPRTGKCVDNGNIDETSLMPFAEDAKFIPVESNAMQSDIQDQENTYNFPWLAGESQAALQFDIQDHDNFAWLAGESQAALQSDIQDHDNSAWLAGESQAALQSDIQNHDNSVWLAGESQAVLQSDIQNHDNSAWLAGESQAALQTDIQNRDNTNNSAWLAGESQAMENSEYAGLDDLLLCDEIFDSSALFTDSQLDSINDLTHYENRMTGNYNVSSETSTAVLDTLELDTPPDFDLSNLTFGSQESILGMTGLL